MKEKILPFIVGLLVGAIIATSCFYVYEKNQKSIGVNSSSHTDFTGGPGMGGQDGEMREFKKREMQNRASDNETENDEDRAELPDGEMSEGEPPELLEGKGGERPQMPNEDKMDREKSTKKKVTNTTDSNEVTNTANV